MEAFGIRALVNNRAVKLVQRAVCNTAGFFCGSFNDTVNVTGDILQQTTHRPCTVDARVRSKANPY